MIGRSEPRSLERGNGVLVPFYVGRDLPSRGGLERIFPLDRGELTIYRLSMTPVNNMFLFHAFSEFVWWLVFDRVHLALLCRSQLSLSNAGLQDTSHGYVRIIGLTIFPSLVAGHVTHFLSTLNAASEGFGDRLSKENLSKLKFSC